jgi:hypothetical protein
MSDMQSERPGEPGTREGEAGPRESEPVAPSVEGRDTGQSSGSETSGGQTSGGGAT